MTTLEETVLVRQYHFEKGRYANVSGKVLAALYLIYFNDFITVDGFSDWVGTSRNEALDIIEKGRASHNMHVEMLELEEITI